MNKTSLFSVPAPLFALFPGRSVGCVGATERVTILKKDECLEEAPKEWIHGVSTVIPWPVLKRPFVAGFEAPNDIPTARKCL
jgi:hypothetical protein